MSANRIATPLVSILALSTLAACGGGGGGGGGQQSFAARVPALQNDAQAFAAGQTFNSSSRVVQVSGAAGQSFTASVEVQIAQNGDLILDFGNGPVTLTQDPQTGTYLFDDGQGTVIAAEAALSDHVGTVLIVSQSPGGPGGQIFSGEFAVIGDPTPNVPAQSGEAIYIGPSAYLAVSDAGAVNGGSGGFIIAADFDSNTAEGRIALQDAPTGTQFALDFANAPITGDGFSSSNLTQTGLNGTVTGSQLDATFYGPNAAQLGGNYAVDLNSGGSNTVITGVLLGEQQDFDAEDLAAAVQAGQTNVNVGGETIVLGSGSVIGGSGSVYPNGASTYYNSNTGVSFGADGGGCYYVGDWSNC